MIAGSLSLIVLQSWFLHAQHVSVKSETLPASRMKFILSAIIEFQKCAVHFFKMYFTNLPYSLLKEAEREHLVTLCFSYILMYSFLHTFFYPSSDVNT